MEAAIACKKKLVDARPEIMIPLVGAAAELAHLRGLAKQAVRQAKAAKKFSGKLEIMIGTMSEIPRAALCADAVFAHADFFSFGTNDLTQMTFGLSRDDVNTFPRDYLAKELLPRDPFVSLDTTGVGHLVEMRVVKGRAAIGW